MKTLKKSILTLSAFCLIFISGCAKSPTSPEESDPGNLTDAEKMLIVASEVCQANGGLMADLQMAAAAASGQVSALPKAAGFDTTITIEWITYSLQFNFYTQNGNEQPFYVENRTDKIRYQGALSGTQTIAGKNQTVTLNRNSSFEITDVISDSININGTSFNKSEYVFQSNNIKLEVKPSGTIAVKNLRIDTKSDNFIPYAGKIEANFKGSYNKEGKLNQKETDYDFTCTIDFTGAATVLVTLPGGVQYQLNLLTGEFSKVN